MPWRWYPKFNKVVRADGTVARYKSRSKKWLKFHKPYKPQKRGLAKQPLYSTRFGFLDLYNRKEQQSTKCPSGYTISQCFNMMRLMWHGYHRARIDDEDVEKMVKYAKAIQKVQEDMGIATTSFPHIGVYGDVLVLNNKKNERVVFEDHSALKEQQEAYEKAQVQSSIKIAELLQKPNENQKVKQYADYSYKKRRKMRKEEELPELLEPNENQEIITMTDDIPWMEK